MTHLKKLTLLLLLIGLSSTMVHSQNVAKKHISPERKAFTDSLKATPYPWRFPILGEKIRKMGFDLPYPNGFMVNYVFGSQYITIDNLKVGTDPDPDTWTNVDGVARFEHIKPFVNVVNLRYDVWLLPFLDVYALGGYIHSTTDVLLALPMTADFTSIGKGWMTGWGLVIAGGAGPLFFTADYNMVWTWMPQLVGASIANVADIRIGHTWDFKAPQANISLMVGAQYLKLNPQSTGSLNLTQSLGITPEKKENAQEQLDDWYESLPTNEQELFANFYDDMSGWLSDEDDTQLYYQFDKKLYYPWSMTVGINWQIDKRFMLTALYTFLGSREQMVIGFNYRFGFKGKTLMSGMEF